MIDTTLASELCVIADKAGKRILQLRDHNKLGVQDKQDGTPVTRADHESQSIILEGLQKLTPTIPVIAEEQDHTRADPTAHATYWLVDPLDGTRDFINGRDDFSISIGLIESGVPAFGIIYAPARDDLVYGSKQLGVFRIANGIRTAINSTRETQSPPRLLVSVRDSKKHPTQEWLEKNIVSEALVHASAYKLALLAAGQADLFLRTSVTYEWDTAAGDAILRACGGWLRTPEGVPLTYQKDGRINGSFLAYCGNNTHADLFLKTSRLDWKPAVQNR